MNITLKKIFLKDIEKVAEPQKNRVKFFLEELYANLSIIENYKIKKLKS